MNASLLVALRIVARADSDPSRAMLFESLAARRRAVRLARQLTQGARRGRLPAALAVAAYALASARVCVAPPRAPIWALPLFENDRRQIARIRAWVDEVRVGRSGGGLRLAAAAGPVIWRAARGRVARRFVRTVQRLCRRHDFLVSCRTASALACAMVAAHSLRRSSVRAVLVSSDYNAEAVGLTHAARRAGRATIYVSHAPTHHLSPPLDCTLAILDGEAALDGYRRKGPVRARCVFKGIEGLERPLDPAALRRPRPAIGLFLPKEVDWSAFARIVAEIRQAFAPRRVLVRPHPNGVPLPDLDRLLGAARDLEVGHMGAAIDEDARACDWVIADRNSGALLAALKAGAPVVPVPGLAVAPGEQIDLYGLVADGVVPPPCASLLELEAAPLVAFYGSGWPDRFRRHDGTYERPPGAAANEVRHAVLEAIGDAS